MYTVPFDLSINEEKKKPKENGKLNYSSFLQYLRISKKQD